MHPSISLLAKLPARITRIFLIVVLAMGIWCAVYVGYFQANKTALVENGFRLQCKRRGLDRSAYGAVVWAGNSCQIDLIHPTVGYPQIIGVWVDLDGLHDWYSGTD